MVLRGTIVGAIPSPRLSFRPIALLIEFAQLFGLTPQNQHWIAQIALGSPARTLGLGGLCGGISCGYGDQVADTQISSVNFAKIFAKIFARIKPDTAIAIKREKGKMNYQTKYQEVRSIQNLTV